MREVAKAWMKRSRAVSLFGAQQLTSELDDFIGWTFRAGDSLQRGIVNLLSGVLTLETFTPRGMMRMTLDMMQRSAEAFSVLMPGRESRVVWQECKNKLEAFDLFENPDSALHLSAETYLPLAALIDETAGMGPYLTVWATEGLGHYYTELYSNSGRAPHQLLGDEDGRVLPAKEENWTWQRSWPGTILGRASRLG